MRVGRSNAVERPSPPDRRISRNRSLVSTAVPKPANIRIVQSFERYIDAYGPRVRVGTGVLGVVGSVDRLQGQPGHGVELGVTPRRGVGCVLPLRSLRHERPVCSGSWDGVASDKQVPDRNLAMELVRVTEAAALAAARWMGRGDKEGADGAAVDAMRIVLQPCRWTASS